jgi:hypothetical protein
VTDDEILAFVQKSISSVWALELLLLLRREPRRSWGHGELVRELRSSDAIVTEAAASLRTVGFVAAEPGGLYSYAPASPELDHIAAQIEATHAARPLSLAKAIMSAPNDKLRIFADAFKLKDQ